MKTNKYLYDEEDLSWLSPLPCELVCRIKILLAEKLLFKLVYAHNIQDDERIKAVKKAIEFNKKQMKLKD